MAKVPPQITGGVEQFDLCFDSGCTSHATGFIEDFIKGSIIPLEVPITMEGIAGSIYCTKKGTVHYEFMSDNGTKEIIEDESYYMPEMGCRLFSPQAYLQSLGMQSDTPDNCNMIVYHDRAILSLKSGNKVTIPLHPRSQLPVLAVTIDLDSDVKKVKAYKGSVTDEVNQNLSVLQKHLLKWHNKLGHLYMQHVQWLGRKGLLDTHGSKWGSTKVIIPKCSACLLGKARRNPTTNKRHHKSNGGNLKTNMLEPGDLIFSDKYECRLEGKVFTYRGASLRAEKYKGGTVFCDAESGYISAHNQTTFTSEETILSKLKFERESMGSGVSIKRYCTDNGVYTSREFLKEIHRNGQNIRHSGVGGHHHNGVAERAIGTVMRTANTILLHTALRWPKFSQKDLWPMAVLHAVNLHNNTPKMDNGLSPMEIWSKRK